jgi:mannose-6-phosphate isomerase-like protein (cupin superfamily)
MEAGRIGMGAMRRRDGDDHAGPVSVDGAPHYGWGEGCDGWRLADHGDLSVIEERMPPGTAEMWHVHDVARQFFYVLDGRAVMRTLDREVRLQTGSGIEVAPGAAHQMANDSDRDVRFLVISTPTTRGDRRPHPGPDTHRRRPGPAAAP